jgi:hypothetical protein
MAAKEKPLILVSLIDLVSRPLAPDKTPLYARDGEHFERGEPKRLEAFLLDGADGWRRTDLDLSWPGAPPAADPSAGVFLATAVGDVDGDGEDEIVVAVTPYSGPCRLTLLKRRGGSWSPLPVLGFDPGDIDFLRSVAVGDVDGDGRAEIVVGTRPNGHVILIDGEGDRYTPTVLDRDAYGAGATNTREVLIADVDNDGRPEILAAIARGHSDDGTPWGPTPGAIFQYLPAAGWRRRLIDDFGGATHTRMILAGDLRSQGRNSLAAVSVGVLHGDGTIDPGAGLHLYDVTASGVTRERIDTLEEAIKSRSVDVGDVDGDGRNELVLGTRNADDRGQTFLHLYSPAPEPGGWRRETLDTSGELGFHCVKIADVDGDGEAEILASDDGRGQLKVYKRAGGRWQGRVILDYPQAIFAVSFAVVRGAG